MKAKFGAIVVDGRGKLGGHVASKNKAGNYFRTKTTPTNPQTSYQTAVRALFAAISQAWSGLSDSVRAGWNSAVADWQKTDIFGDLKSPTGKALFQRLNNQAQSAGYAAVTTAPARLPMVEGVITAAGLTSIASTLSFTGVYTGGDAAVVVFATPVLSNGTSFVKNKLRQIYASEGDTYVAADAYAAYVAKFGAFANNDNIYLGVKYVLPNGQASPLQVVKAIVAA